MNAVLDFRSFDAGRRSSLFAELKYALNGMQDQELRSWALQIPITAGSVSLRRGRNLKATVSTAGNWLRKEWSAASTAYKRHKLQDHLTERTKSLAGQSVDIAQSANDIVHHYGNRLAADPRNEAPVLIAGLVGFLMGSGGVDGDGGIPDLDLLGGIGAHRSLLTHTIVAGIVAETLVRAVADLATRVHGKLPNPHDELWEFLALKDSRVIEALCTGVSLGLAYHFTVDATADAGGAYAGLKGLVSPAVDNAIQAGNTVVEGNDALKRVASRRFFSASRRDS